MRLSPTRRRIALTTATLAALAIGGAAQATSLVQCNKLINGTFTPVLMVEQAQNSTTYNIGDKGLTKSIIFSENKAKAWARSALGVNASSYHPCGLPSKNDRRDR